MEGWKIHGTKWRDKWGRVNATTRQGGFEEYENTIDCLLAL